MKGKNVTIFGLGAIGGFIGGNVFAFYKMLHSKRIRKALTDIVADKIETVLYGEECHSPSIADYYDLAGLPSNVYTNTKYGWLDLKDAKVIDSMDGYKISLPKVLILN